MNASGADSFLVMRDVRKAFPGVQALDGANLEVRAGECHALVGENGAGKSTLMKILAGAIQPDGGEIFVGGKLVWIGSPIDACRLGISAIYQELHLIPELSVAENIFLGREPRRAGGILSRRRMIEESRKWFSRLHQDIDPRRPTRALSLAHRQMVEIVKSLSFEARILIMDEPSAILSDRELEELFRLILQIKAQGLGIIYISHRLEEIYRICDRVTVMRDGRTVANHEVPSVAQSVLVREMVGRDLDQVFPQRKEPLDEVALEVRNVGRRPRLRNVSIYVRRGEIVGLAGLVGAGRTELARVIFGADSAEQGEIRFEGRTLTKHTPDRAIRAGMGFLTEDRKSQGLLLNLNVRENVTLADLSRISKNGLLKRKAERELVMPLVGGLKVKTPSLDQEVRLLSGGNQQKTILARWLFTQSRFLIFDEPTRGIDVGAKAEIYQLIADLAAEGRGILVISSELPEILGLCHRIYVMRDGEIAGEYAAAEMNQEKLLAKAMGVPSAE